uniref:Uncharacterized protein n=1 Tax=Panagrolaimus sp. JU765 TaxID=591449 RepID=A0AC34QSY7_9BILA
MENCEDCKKAWFTLFEPQTKKQFIVSVLNGKKKRHKCIYDLKKIKYEERLANVIYERLKVYEQEREEDRVRLIPKDSSKEDSSILPHIPFKTLDYSQQQRFYQIVPPSIRHKLWTSSKKSSGLGNRPCVMIGCYLARIPSKGQLREFHDFVTMTNFQVQNLVIDFRKAATFENMDNSDFLTIQKFVNFNHDELILMDSKIDPFDLPIICHPKVTKITVDNSEFDWKFALELNPKITHLDIKKILENGWEKKVAESNTDYESLKFIFEENPKKLTINICNKPEYDFKVFQEFFKYCDIDDENVSIICLEGYRFCLRKPRSPYQRLKNWGSIIISVLLLVAFFLLKDIIGSAINSTNITNVNKTAI